jgi:hypothetical protein
MVERIRTHFFRTAALPLVVLLLFVCCRNAAAQHNGDPLLYQGLTQPNTADVNGAALGNASVSRSNDINSLFHNAAGLANIKSIQISVSPQYRTTLVRDNEQFYPGSGYVGTNLYLEHLLIPDPAWNNVWDDVLKSIVYDSLGNPIGKNWWNADKISHPVQGVDEYSEETADHQQKQNSGISLGHIAIAVPFQLFGKNIVAAASYNRQYDVYNYDWNGAYLDPHWGSSDLIKDTIGATVRSNWSVFTRERIGGLYAATGAIALQWNDNFQFGAKLNILSGTTTDKLTLDRIGYFRFIHGGTRWSFSYDTNNLLMNGSSDFSSVNLSLGALLVSKNFCVGLNVQLPYTVQRTWAYTTQVTDTSGIHSSSVSGVDKVAMPAVYTMGLTIMPAEGLSVSFDYEAAPYGNARYSLAPNNPDPQTIYTKWVDQVSLRFGVEYAITDDIAVRGGYQSQGASFIGNGVAVRDEGAPIESFSGGASVKFLHGRFDGAYTFSQLKYYDVYMTNRNYTLVQTQTLAVGYTYIF